MIGWFCLAVWVCWVRIIGIDLLGLVVYVVGIWVLLVGSGWWDLVGQLWFVGFGWLGFNLVGLICRVWVVCGWLVAG